MRSEELYEVRKLTDTVYLILEKYADDNALVMGVVIGDNKAALIDSGMGMFGDELKNVVRSVTDKPIINILTHGHPDHIAGSVLFDEVLMSELDDDQIPRLAKEKRMGDTAFFSHDNKELVAYAQAHCLDCSGFHYRNISSGQTVELGNVTLEILALPGHSAGSIAILNRKDGICFVGDAFNASLPCSSLKSLSQFKQMADGISTFCEAVPADTLLYGGHWTEPISWDLVRDERDAANELAEEKTEGDQDVYLPISPVPHQKKHVYGTAGISYNPAILNH